MINEMQEYYRRRASIYDSSMGYDRPEVLERHQPVIHFLQQSLTGKTVLEIACGPGFWTAQVASVARSITATDYNEETLIEARKKEIDWTKVKFLQADAYRLPSFDREFDACFAVDWFCHIPISKRRGFLNEIHRHLADSALVIFCDQIPKSTSLTGSYDEEGNHLQTRLLPDGSNHTVIKNFPSEDELVDLFASCSRNVQVYQFPESNRLAVTYLVKKWR